MLDERKKMPVVALRGITLLPEMVTHFDITRAKSILAVEKAMSQEQTLFLVAQKDENIKDPTESDVFEIGCIGEIKQVIKLPKNVMRILVIGRKRGRIIAFDTTKDYLESEVEVVEDVFDDSFEGEDKLHHIEAVDRETKENSEIKVDREAQEDRESFLRINNEAKMRELKEAYSSYVSSFAKEPKELIKQVASINELEKLVNIIAANSRLSFEHKQDLLETYNFEERYTLLLAKLYDEIEISAIKESIHIKVKERIDKTQREFILREQIKVIKQELGEDPITAEADEFTAEANKLEASSEVKEKIEKEIKKFKNIQNNSPESSVIRNYIETLLEMPWDKSSEACYDLSYAETVLNRDHYGLEDVKERILEYIAVRSFAKAGDSPILCLVGPPGTGKTSIARSLAEATNKKYVRLSLGGVHDEAEIRGHRKTYIGAMPGRIAKGLKEAGTKNPLMVLDEIDKVGIGNKGDTFSALLEVLDGEQNVKFRDHYLELPVDLSDVFFVATANTLQGIPKPLLDRMEIITVSSYTDVEKAHIAKEHLVEKQLKKHGLTKNELTISKEAIEKLIPYYTKEAGVRQLEREIGTLCRKATKELLEKKKGKIRIGEKNLEKYLGEEKYKYILKNEIDQVGIVRGLAWTSVGGDTLEIEVNVIEVGAGKGGLKMTGQLGDVMKESATIAMSYIASIAPEYGVDINYFESHTIHIHIPAGAVPKDGPSAGITMALAILSGVTEKKVKANLAMTGEITLRGRVLPIGGLKEKLLAAKHAGIQTVLIPKENEKEISKMSTEITSNMEIIPVDHMKQVCELAFV